MDCKITILILLCQFFMSQEHFINKRNDHYVSNYSDIIPTKQVRGFLLYAVRSKIYKHDFVTGTTEEVLIRRQSFTSVVSVDYDTDTNCVYWSNQELTAIFRQCPNDTNSEILLSKDLNSVGDIALDRISHNLYFVNNDRIELIRTDTKTRMRKTILDDKTLDEPHSIVVHPRAGYIFWADVDEDELVYPSVNRADLDGSNVKKLFKLGSMKMQCPIITVDYETDRIYWLCEHSIGSTDLDGGSRKVIVKNEEKIVFPLGLTVFANRIYWADSQLFSIFSVNKDKGGDARVLQRWRRRLLDVKAFGDDVRTGSNGCVDAGCDYICVGLPEGRSACLCPNGIQDCSSRPIKCSEDYFACSNSKLCVPQSWRCDGDDDCGDNSDEMNCPKSTCTENEFTCDNGRCIKDELKCNGVDNCKDGSDEVACPKKNCEFVCDNGRCVNAIWKCDGFNHCEDDSDEVNCPKWNCTVDQFACKNGLCIDGSLKCNGINNCRDGSDEMNCPKKDCDTDDFACNNELCIYNWKCDRFDDCVDDNAFDEKYIPNLNCSPDDFACDSGECINVSLKCNGFKDCKDCSDERRCEYNN